MELAFYQCKLEDAEALRDFLYRAFQDAYAGMMAQPTIGAYMKKAFDLDKLRVELEKPGSAFFFLYADGTLAGCLKTNESPAQSDLNDPQSLEIERIYLASKFRGRGLGNALMDKAVAIAKQKNKTHIWLGVWENNGKAIRFYKKNGFYQAGTHGFVMGEERQTDFIMRKDLSSVSHDSPAVSTPDR